MSENTHVYIGTLPCGCHVAAAVDCVDDKKRTAKMVRDMVFNGYIVSRHPLIELRDGTIRLHTCTHEDRSVQGSLV